MIGQGLHHRLANPPHGVADELDVARRIETSRRLNQPEIAFVNEIEKRDAEAAIPFGEAHDEAEVGFDQARHRRLIAVALNTVPELALFLDGQARQLRDLAQIRRERTRLTLARRMPPRHTEKHTSKSETKIFNFQF